METNKYYTPEIEEFHVGFEYEHKLHLVELIPEDMVPGNMPLPEGEWLKETFKYPFYHKGLINFYNFFRVKYLDQQDIESLGWEEEIDSPDGRFSILKDDIWYYLIQYGHNQKYEIRCMNPSYKYGSFLGTIKNKSELHKLMKQLGINE